MVLRVFQSWSALSHSDTLEMPCHSTTRVPLPALESMESKIHMHTSYRSYSTNVYIQNRRSTALKLLGNTARTEIMLSSEKP